ncbi:MAG TPA: GerMN domain-containing protein, partial [bacterium]|nr:GerMN domain-containing protein [bacterium]
PYVGALRDPKGFLRGWRIVALLGGLAALGAIAFGLELALRREEPPGVIPPERSDVAGRTVEIMFPGVTEGWVREEREILAADRREIMIRRLVEELVKGPSSKASAVFPPSTQVRDVFWDSEGELTVIFSEDLRSGHPGGSRAETATIESLLGSVELNFPEVQRLRILIEGEVVASLAGHVDLSGPLDTFIPR